MEYKLVIAEAVSKEEAARKLEKEVAKLLADGWQPQGGVSVAACMCVSVICAQAMIKE